LRSSAVTPFKIECIFYAKVATELPVQVYYFQHFWQNQPGSTLLKGDAP
jgi:hypothetical protein